MEKIEFVNGWKDFFSKKKLKTFEDFILYTDGRIVNKNKKRDVVRMTFETDDGQRVFYMKRFYSPHYKDMIFAFMNHGQICSQAELEYKNARYLLDRRIETYRPVCFGSRSAYCLEKASFFVTEEIKGREVTDFIAENHQSMTEDQKNILIKAIAKFISKIHNSNISMSDLYLWHIFLINEKAAENGNYEFAVIDLHRMSVRLNLSKRARNLAAFNFSLNEKYFDDKLIKEFFDSYTGGLEINSKKLLSLVARRTEILKGRRRRVEY